jgi:hypothetical protein
VQAGRYVYGFQHTRGVVSERLADLDELVLRCRDERAKRYIAEAAACYRGGAFRSCIVATWIAVAYDVIDKLQELALTGDKQAEQEVERFERIRASADVASALKFERDLLEMATDKFELLSPVEHLDLSRLQEDRNRCAHPSMAAAGEVYSPPAELARLHLRNAVSYLLQRQPVQGKAAMERVMAEINSPYFPTDSTEAFKHFEHGPLVRPRDSLVRNLATVLLKTLLLEPVDWHAKARYLAALRALRQLHHQAVESVLSARLPELVRRVGAGDLGQVVRLIANLGDVWEFLSADLQNMLRRYVARMPSGNIGLLNRALSIPPLRDAAEGRASTLGEEDFENAFLWETHQIIWDRAVSLYLESGSFDTANRRVKFLVSGADELSREQIERVLRGAAENREVKHSFGFPGLVEAIREHSDAMAPHELDAQLRESGFDHLAAADDEA